MVETTADLFSRASAYSALSRRRCAHRKPAPANIASPSITFAAKSRRGRAQREIAQLIAKSFLVIVVTVTHYLTLAVGRILRLSRQSRDSPENRASREVEPNAITRNLKSMLRGVGFDVRVMVSVLSMCEIIEFKRLTAERVF